jgi:hypothetical protein
MGDCQLFWVLTITLDACFDEGFGGGFLSPSEPSSKSASRSLSAGSSSLLENIHFHHPHHNSPLVETLAFVGGI